MAGQRVAASNPQTAQAMVGIRDDLAPPLRFQFPCPLLNLAHRQKLRPGQAHQRMLVGLAAVEQNEIVTRGQLQLDTLAIDLQGMCVHGIISEVSDRKIGDRKIALRALLCQQVFCLSCDAGAVGGVECFASLHALPFGRAASIG